MSDPDENLDFLLNPDQIEAFTEMLESRINAGEAQKQQLIAHQKQIEETLNGLRSKLKNLQNYRKFLDLKGYAYTKQTADSYFEEMEQAAKTRIPEEDTTMNGAFHFTNRTTPPETCGEYFTFQENLCKCLKPRDHLGECGF